MIQLSIPLRVRIIHPHPLDSENFGSIAVARGPLIYCAESIDNHKIKDLRMIRIPDNVQFREISIPFPSNTTLTGLKAEISIAGVIDDIDNDGWVDLSLESQTLTMIPFFAWANRGPSDLRTWLPRLL